MRARLLLSVTFIALLIAGCSGSSTATPDGTVRLLYDYVKDGEMTAVKSLTTEGYLDDYGAKKLRRLFLDDSVTGIQTEVLEKQNHRARVLITLVTTAGNKKGSRPLTLLFQDGGWKIKHSKWKSWPSALKASNY